MNNTNDDFDHETLIVICDDPGAGSRLIRDLSLDPTSCIVVGDLKALRFLDNQKACRFIVDPDAFREIPSELQHFWPQGKLPFVVSLANELLPQGFVDVSRLMLLNYEEPTPVPALIRRLAANARQTPSINVPSTPVPRLQPIKITGGHP